MSLSQEMPRETVDVLIARMRSIPGRSRVRAWLVPIAIIALFIAAMMGLAAIGHLELRKENRMYTKRFNKSLIAVYAVLVLTANIAPPVLTQATASESAAAARLNFQKGQAAEGRNDYAAAFLLYRKAAEAGEPRAMFNLAMMYVNGRGTVKDKVATVKWLRKAAEAGEQRGMFAIGVLYDRGLGVAQDVTEALKWYRKAAAVGDPQGMFSLGVMYANGIGVAKDEVEAVKWVRKAAEAGSDDAKRALTRLGK